MGNTSGIVLHEGRNQKVDDAEVHAVAAQLLANECGVADEGGCEPFTSQLFTMVAEKRISRQDGSLLAYIASVLLQTITPVNRKVIAGTESGVC